LRTLAPSSGDWITNSSRGLDIDGRGDVVGDSQSAAGDTHATFWPCALHHAFSGAATLGQLSRRAVPGARGADKAGHDCDIRRR
jgi:hypothetical protein